MAMHASRMTQDQNFSVHSDGAKMNESTMKKNKGGVGVRKALNDISNSVKPSALQPLRKQNLKNVLPIGEDVGVGKKPLAKAQASGRKALGDLTNMVKPFGQQQGLKNKSQVKQSLTIAEDVPYSIAEEGFRHNHDECVKQQKNVSFDDFNEFLHAIGHENDPLFQSVSTACKPLPRKPKEDNAFMIFEMEEIAEDQAFGSPICKSPPKSPKMSSKPGSKVLYLGAASRNHCLSCVSDGTKVEYWVWNPFRSKLAAAVLGGVDNIWMVGLPDASGTVLPLVF
uniref:Protein patronus 1-like n=1 Tax=Tanacetum cinerariifolium TaxID=118510 RepID=A0A6L2MTH8_TANCI|nr:protein patronus 1-like [Tanacetum cinerariifolium]